MTAPTKTDLQTLDWVDLGQPFVYVAAPDGLDTATLDVAHGGQPFYAAGAGAAPPPPAPPARAQVFVVCM